MRRVSTSFRGSFALAVLALLATTGLLPEDRIDAVEERQTPAENKASRVIRLRNSIFTTST